MSLTLWKRWRYPVAVTVFFMVASAACAETQRGEVEEGLTKIANSIHVGLGWVAVAIAIAGVFIGAGIYSAQQLRRRE